MTEKDPLMKPTPSELTAFLLRAKRSTYAAKAEESAPSRPGSHDIRYAEGPFEYVDSFLGQTHFSGQEAVWYRGVPLWSMNYCGQVTGEGFDGDFLKAALMAVPENAPFRGPIEYQEAGLLYVNNYAGDLDWFFGREEIYRSGISVYTLVYHGGQIL